MLKGLSATNLVSFRNEVKTHFKHETVKGGRSDAAAVASQKVGGDRISFGQPRSEAVTYSSGVADVDSASQYNLLRSLLIETLQEQGVATKLAVGDSTIDIENLSPQEAQKLIEEDGYFGVEQTSERIFTFAAGMIAGDPERIEAVRRGIEQGFAEAEKAFGGSLPEISYQTIDRLNEKLDDLAESLTIRA